MANLTIVVPNTLVPDLVLMASAKLQEKNIDISGMNSTQIGQRYLAEHLKEDYIAWSRQKATAMNQATLDAALISASTAVTTAIATATTDTNGISG
jgi:hypothetical protein